MPAISSRSTGWVINLAQLSAQPGRAPQPVTAPTLDQRPALSGEPPKPSVRARSCCERTARGDRVAARTEAPNTPRVNPATGHRSPARIAASIRQEVTDDLHALPQRVQPGPGRERMVAQARDLADSKPSHGRGRDGQARRAIRPQWTYGRAARSTGCEPVEWSALRSAGGGFSRRLARGGLRGAAPRRVPGRGRGCGRCR